MKYLDYNGLATLSNAIKGDLSNFRDTVVPTFEEVYTNLFAIDEDIEEHKEGEVTDPDGVHGVRYVDGAFQVASPTYTPASPESGSPPCRIRRICRRILSAGRACRDLKRRPGICRGECGLWRR